MLTVVHQDLFPLISNVSSSPGSNSRTVGHSRRPLWMSNRPTPSTMRTRKQLEDGRTLRLQDLSPRWHADFRQDLDKTITLSKSSPQIGPSPFPPNQQCLIFAKKQLEDTLPLRLQYPSPSWHADFHQDEAHHSWLG
jgi:hypothetical protein